MKHFIFLFFISLILSCTSHSEFLYRQSAKEYYCMPNIIADTLILDYLDDTDYITYEKVLYKYENANYLYLLANPMGGKSSILIAIQKKPTKVVYHRESAYCDSARIIKIKGHKFLVVKSHYRDMCSEEEYFSIYLIENGIHECFNDISKSINFEGLPCSENYESFEQNFNLEMQNNEIVLIAYKIGHDAETYITKYTYNCNASKFFPIKTDTNELSKKYHTDTTSNLECHIRSEHSEHRNKCSPAG